MIVQTNEADPLSALLGAVIERGPWSHCAASLYDLDSGDLVLRSHVGFGPELAARWVDRLERNNPSRTAMHTGSAVAIPDIRSNRRYLSWTSRNTDGYASSLYVPVRLGPHQAAVLSVHRPVAHDYSQAELRLAGAIASMAALLLRGMAGHRLASPSGRPDAVLADVGSRLLDAHGREDWPTLMCAAVATALGSPVLLLDRFSQVIATADVDPALAARLAGGIVSPRRSAASGLPDHGTGARPVTVDGVPLLVGDAEGLGTLAVLAGARSERGLAAEVIELACRHIGIAARTMRASIDAEARAAGDLIGVLLAGGADASDLERRAGLLGLRLDRPTRVLRARISGTRQTPDPAEMTDLALIARRHLRDRGLDALVCPVDLSELALIVSVGAGDGAELLESLRRSLAEGMSSLRLAAPGRGRVQIGVGASGIGAEAIRRSDEGATQALHVIESGAATTDQLAIEDAGIFSLLTSIPSSDRIAFVRRHLGALVAYDRRYGSDLIPTLACYLECAGNAQRAADELFLHVSTVRYRLSRIEQLAGVSLRSHHDRLCLGVALHLLRLDDLPTPGHPSPTKER
ncbi:helix-turn-helix domain-containing protein [Cnuibacter physcomitrellae]|uniref:helix-turn-helix domain-containing protein n=1 Tax=Cnuibacter physcomitrellae TaxID=1619308 RepID=UPI0021759EFA|nr:helix-turn-helix domain-containing protein [Cnuibacter physcomitrellae]MCS5498296.1 helix-turn-helix domain-containing protein [Cnuibacter physcomitrellae]